MMDGSISGGDGPVIGTRRLHPALINASYLNLIIKVFKVHTQFTPEMYSLSTTSPSLGRW
jgi:hypothetical protein